MDKDDLIKEFLAIVQEYFIKKTLKRPFDPKTYLDHAKHYYPLLKPYANELADSINFQQSYQVSIFFTDICSFLNDKVDQEIAESFPEQNAAVQNIPVIDPPELNVPHTSTPQQSGEELIQNNAVQNIPVVDPSDFHENFVNQTPEISNDIPNMLETEHFTENFPIPTTETTPETLQMFVTDENPVVPQTVSADEGTAETERISDVPREIPGNMNLLYKTLLSNARRHISTPLNPKLACSALFINNETETPLTDIPILNPESRQDLTDNLDIENLAISIPADNINAHRQMLGSSVAQFQNCYDIDSDSEFQLLEEDYRENYFSSDDDFDILIPIEDTIKIIDAEPSSAITNNSSDFPIQRANVTSPTPISFGQLLSVQENEAPDFQLQQSNTPLSDLGNGIPTSMFYRENILPITDEPNELITNPEPNSATLDRDLSLADIIAEGNHTFSRANENADEVIEFENVTKVIRENDLHQRVKHQRGKKLKSQVLIPFIGEQNEPGTSRESNLHKRASVPTFEEFSKWSQIYKDSLDMQTHQKYPKFDPEVIFKPGFKNDCMDFINKVTQQLAPETTPDDGNASRNEGNKYEKTVNFITANILNTDNDEEELEDTSTN